MFDYAQYQGKSASFNKNHAVARGGREARAESIRSSEAWQPGPCMRMRHSFLAECQGRRRRGPNNGDQCVLRGCVLHREPRQTGAAPAKCLSSQCHHRELLRSDRSLTVGMQFPSVHFGPLHAFKTTTLLLPYLCVGIFQVLDTKQVLLFTFKKVLLECR